MPLPLLAHQAPVLPLKLWRPTAFNGTALVVGSVAPDFEYFLDRGGRAASFGHIATAQLLFCLPVTLFVVLLVGHLGLGEVVAARFARLRWLSGAATDVKSAGGLLRAAASALTGSFSHLLLDAVTHDVIPKWFTPRTVHVGGLAASMPAVVQLVASVVLAIVTLWTLWRISMQNASSPPVPRGGAAVLIVFAALGVALGVRQSLPALRHPDSYFDAGRLYVWGHTAFFVACGLVAGVLVGAVPLAIWDRRSAT